MKVEEAVNELNDLFWHGQAKVDRNLHITINYDHKEDFYIFIQLYSNGELRNISCNQVINGYTYGCDFDPGFCPNTTVLRQCAENAHRHLMLKIAALQKG